MLYQPHILKTTKKQVVMRKSHDESKIITSSFPTRWEGKY